MVRESEIDPTRPPDLVVLPGGAQIRLDGVPSKDRIRPVVDGLVGRRRSDEDDEGKEREREQGTRARPASGWIRVVSAREADGYAGSVIYLSESLHKHGRNGHHAPRPRKISRLPLAARARLPKSFGQVLMRRRGQRVRPLLDALRVRSDDAGPLRNPLGGD